MNMSDQNFEKDYVAKIATGKAEAYSTCYHFVQYLER